MVYRFREGYSLPVPAQIVGEHIARIEKRVGKTFGAHHLREDARSKKSPIHPCFTWDDVKAAEERRLDQARQILRSIEEVVINERGVEVRRIAYVSVSDGPSNYMNIQAAMSDKDIADRVIAEALAVAEGWNRRYAHIVEIAQEFAPLVKIINRLSQQRGGKDGTRRQSKDRKASVNKRARQPVIRADRPAQNHTG